MRLALLYPGRTRRTLRSSRGKCFSRALEEYSRRPVGVLVACSLDLRRTCWRPGGTSLIVARVVVLLLLELLPRYQLRAERLTPRNASFSSPRRSFPVCVLFAHPQLLGDLRHHVEITERLTRRPFFSIHRHADAATDIAYIEAFDLVAAGRMRSAMRQSFSSRDAAPLHSMDGCRSANGHSFQHVIQHGRSDHVDLEHPGAG